MFGHGGWGLGDHAQLSLSVILIYSCAVDIYLFMC